MFKAEKIRFVLKVSPCFGALVLLRKTRDSGLKRSRWPLDLSRRTSPLEFFISVASCFPVCLVSRRVTSNTVPPSHFHVQVSSSLKPLTCNSASGGELLLRNSEWNGKIHPEKHIPKDCPNVPLGETNTLRGQMKHVC